ncbi:hypothetical protein Q31b_33020 [Novipirellula aureliae]|uniref:Endonuclease/Exonuclease/phosphatase family protein n=1 Tax=Novipirellula aureliae TaxID=2527966 RepID=A0A5C6DY47_9BACT|nr:endonuclease/exonuclease/phosphatase family protein [Novipirellula aureliae]TWU39986.1 hypothetical protein Q31b_33020 [Novipirellula aureliae]
MRIATWNLARPTSGDSAKAKLLMEHIKRDCSDIWILTESHSDVSPGSDFEMRSTTGSDRAQSEGEVWTAIWCRFPIVRELAVVDPIRSVCVEIATPDGSLIVYGTVLPWLADTWFDPLRGADAFVSVFAKQATDWTRIQAENPDSGFCIAGDLNQDLANSHYCGSRVGRTALRDAIKTSGLNCLASGEFDRVSELTEGRCSAIDHNCLSESWTSRFRRSSNVWPGESERTSSLSDHFGVWVDIETIDYTR